MIFHESKAEPGPAHAPWFEKKLGDIFGKTCIYFDFSKRTMFTICILFTTLMTKTKGMCEGASKQTQDLKIILTRDRALWF